MTTVTVVQRAPTVVIGQRGLQGAPGPSGAVSTFAAAQTLSAHRAVRLAATGLVYAGSDDPNSLGAEIWLTLQAGAAGTPLQVARPGQNVTEAGWSWTPAQPVFLHPNGVLAHALPAGLFSRIVGVAITPTELQVVDRDPIRYSS